MTVNFSNVIKVISFLFIVLGVSMLPALLVAIIYAEKTSILAFFITIIHCILFGTIFWKIYHLTDLKKMKERDGFLVLSICWLIAPAIGCMPYVMSGVISNFFDAFFETVSGFTTTGCSILTDVEKLPKSILFWRAFTQWIGGIGIIVFASALLPSIGIKGQAFTSTETHRSVLDKISPKTSDLARRLYLLYFLLTGTQFLLLLLGGLDCFDALLHTFGTISTGGFTAYNNGVSHFGNYFVLWVTVIFMILSGINFNLYFLLLKKKVKEFFKDAELKFYLSIISIISVLIFVNIMAAGYGQHMGIAFTDAVFQVASIVSTTGFTSCDYDLWPTFSKMMIFLLMLTGACSSSAGSGVKMIRILVALKMIRRGVSLKLHPNRFVPITIGNRPVPQEAASNIANYIFLYITVIFIGAFLVSFNDYDLMTTISSVVSCVGNIGPGFNLVGPSMDFSIFSNFSKLILSFLMIAGRLELFAFFLLFSPHYWNANKV